MFERLKARYGIEEDTNLEPCEEDINKFLLKCGNGVYFKRIEEESLGNLSPYLRIFREIEMYENRHGDEYRQSDKFEEKKAGLYIMDSNGIYTAADSGQFGLCHLRRLDSTNNIVYALTAFDNTRIYFTDDSKFVILFVNVIKTRIGFSFLNNTFKCIPTPSINRTLEPLYLYMDRKTTVGNINQVDESEWNN